MFNNLSLARRTISWLSTGALAILATAPRVLSQTVPIPFMTTYAGLAAGATPANAICSSSLPVYAVSGTGSKYGDGCPATQASLSVPLSVAVDKTGDVFISDQTHQIIRVVYNGTGSDALAAAIIAANVENPGLVPVKGDIYTIAGGSTVTPTTHYCNGSGTGPQGDDLELDGCPGAQTFEQLNRGVAVDADGNVFLSNGAVYPTIRVFYVGGVRAAALIQLVDPTLTPQPGFVYKVAGYGGTTFRTAGSSCSGAATNVLGDGCPAAQAYLNAPRGLFVDASENIYFADQGDNVVRRIDGTTSIITSVAGTCVVNSTATGCLTAASPPGDGTLATSSGVNIYQPYGVALDQNGNVFIAEGGSGSTVPVTPGRIRVVYAAGTLPGIASPTPGYIYTYAGGGAATGTPAQMTTFQQTYGVSIDAEGYLYVTDYRDPATSGDPTPVGSNHIWRVDPNTGNILIFAGTGSTNLVSGQHCDRVKQLGIITYDSVSDGCPATQSYLNTPQGGIAFDGYGNGYIADRGDNLVRKLAYNNIFPSMAVGATSALLPEAFYFPASTSLLSKTATLQGVATGEFSSTSTANDNCPLGAPLPAAPITCVTYVSFQPAVAGPRNAAYNLVDATGVVATLAMTGTGTAPVLTINPGSSVALSANVTPSGISTDLHGNVYVSDAKGKQVLRTSVSGGAGTTILTGLGLPRQTTTDSFGTLYVADSANNNIVKLAYGSTAATTIGGGMNAPRGVVADFLGNLFIADTGNNRLLYYSTVSGTLYPVSTNPITLSAPTTLALDGAGNLYVIDSNNTRVVEVPASMPATTLAIPVGITPAAIAFDPANDVYLADTASGSVFFVPSTSAISTTLLSGFNSFAGIAVDPNGNLFIADSSGTTATAYNTTVNNSTFTKTNIPSSSLPITLTLTDVGNASAILMTPPYTESGNTAAFVSSGSPTCVAAFVLAPGNTCTQSFVFTPTVAGAQTAKAIFNTTTSQSVTANLSATATSLTVTSLAIAPQGATASYGQTTTYSVTLTLVSTTVPPTGQISFLVDGNTVATKNVGASPYTFTFPLSTSVGVHSVGASYSGDTVYGGSGTLTMLTVKKATTTTLASYTQSSAGTVFSAVVSASSKGAIAFTGNLMIYVDGSQVANTPVNGATGGTSTATVLLPDGTHIFYAVYTGDPNYAGSTSTPVQTFVITRGSTTTTLTVNSSTVSGTAGYLFTAKVTSTATGTPTGVVTFVNGTTVLGTATLTAASNGLASLFVGTTTYMNYAFVASYVGDGLFEPSVSQLPQFFLITAAAPLGVPQGGQVTSTVSIAPVNGYTGTLTPVCSGLPVNALCRFYPTTVAVTKSTATTFSAQMYAGVNPSVANLSLPAPASRRNEAHILEAGAMLSLLLLAPAVLHKSRRRQGNLPYLLAFVVLFAILLGITGCGTTIKTPAVSSTTYTTPAGLYPIAITVTDTNGLTQSNILTINVTP